MDKILVLEDNKHLASHYRNILIDNNYDVRVVHSDEEFFKTYSQFYADLLILDIKIANSRLTGLDIFKQLKERNQLQSKVIVLSGEASRSEVATAMKLGAYTFIEKNGNFDIDKFISDIKQAINLKKQEDHNLNLKKDYEAIRSKLIATMPLIGNSPSILAIKKKIEIFAKADIDVLIVGETGTGKEVIANNLYWNSNRAGKPFIKVNSGGLPESLIDSQLYGHSRGSFTGAFKSNKGYFEQANHGILFLDEIANLSITAQAKILRTIENREINIVGGETKFIDVKMIFACNKDLRTLISEKKFRIDLYYRLEGNSITLPPLRERETDILLFMDHFLSLFSAKYQIPFDVNLENLYDTFMLYQWPGNIRELEKFCESTFILNNFVDNKVLIREFEKKRYGEKENFNNVLISINNPNYQDVMNDFEKKYLTFQFESFNRRVSLMAKEFGIDKSTLYKKFKRLGIRYK